jgi:N-methylhydantoinase A
MSYRLSVDTGGTFTDVVVADLNGKVVIGKALTTHDRIFRGVAAAIGVAAEQLEITTHELLAETSSSMAPLAPLTRSSRSGRPRQPF